MNKTNLKSFKIVGLFDKKDFYVEFDDLVKILISENGGGKTTILNIIVNFFRGNIGALRSLPFREIEVWLKDKSYYSVSKEVFLKRKFFEQRIIREIRKVCMEYDLEYSLIKEITNLYENTFDIKLILTELKKNKVSNMMLSRIERMYDFYSRNYSEEEEEEEERKKYREFLKKINFSVEYFPTYRRIEKRFITEEGGIFDSEINFGMDDVEKLINGLTEKIKSNTVKLFSEMNKEIIYELINDDKKISSCETKKLISNSNIEIVLNRIQDSNDERNLKDLLDKKLNFTDSEGKFLGYYLLKINSIYEKQEKNENKINNFIEVCNSYLFNKKFIYLAKETKVILKDEENKKINLSDLSSGEKQIVSLFSKLYLGDKNNLMIVIDEPELSISILWQKKILVDIVKSGKCSLLLTTTHSPFIFDNEFDDCAHSLNEYFTLTKKGDLK